METELFHRRMFLKRAALLGGSAALLSFIKPTAAPAEPPAQQPSESGRGYRLTEHIRKYYETARF